MISEVTPSVKRHNDSDFLLDCKNALISYLNTTVKVEPDNCIEYEASCGDNRTEGYIAIYIGNDENEHDIWAVRFFTNNNGMYTVSNDFDLVTVDSDAQLQKWLKKEYKQLVASRQSNTTTEK